MIVLSGAALVLPDRILDPGTLVIDGGHIVDMRAERGRPSPALRGHFIVPGFIDVHVHGAAGVDVIASADGISTLARLLPRYGITGFCPTTVACAPDTLEAVLAQVRRAREQANPNAARVLPAHLESNFINPDFRGAQPAEHICRPRSNVGREVLAAIDRWQADVGCVTMAPEIDGGMELLEWLVTRQLTVSLGHSAATFDQAQAAIAAGATRATHLFNRMPPLHHRAPGLVGAVLQTYEIAAELICDGAHVHPSLIRTAVMAKTLGRVIAITDGTAAAGLEVGARARLADLTIIAGAQAASLEDGTTAGSVQTMDKVFAFLVSQVGLSLVEAATICATTPARELKLPRHGVLARDAVADLVVLDPSFSVVQTYVAGRLVYARGTNASPAASV